MYEICTTCIVYRDSALSQVRIQYPPSTQADSGRGVIAKVAKSHPPVYRPGSFRAPCASTLPVSPSPSLRRPSTSRPTRFPPPALLHRGSETHRRTTSIKIKICERSRHARLDKWGVDGRTSERAGSSERGGGERRRKGREAERRVSVKAGWGMKAGREPRSVMHARQHAGPPSWTSAPIPSIRSRACMSSSTRRQRARWPALGTVIRVDATPREEQADDGKGKRRREGRRREEGDGREEGREERGREGGWRWKGTSDSGGQKEGRATQLITVPACKSTPAHRPLQTNPGPRPWVPAKKSSLQALSSTENDVRLMQASATGWRFSIRLV
ncbi:hypothetical protein C8R45DRAFT_934059 [Mycena sanguinolenta]|nr:hypothetical protein C8R45DRAFT_934059 [Mycena sanguinolenta]